MPWVRWGLAILLLALTAGWVRNVLVDWPEIESRPTRVAYLLCDALLVIPAGAIAFWADHRRRPWARPALAFALGLVAFDLLHGIVYTARDNFFGVPWPLVAALAGLALVFSIVAWIAILKSSSDGSA
jgi:peptidoglycan/LPS O-acetylase OafA/YrhL